MSVSCETQVKFAVENWAALWRDGRHLFPYHWRELAIDQEDIKLSLDESAYIKLDALGNLHIVTMRAEGKVVGYYIAFLMLHPHYKDAGLMAVTDVYYVIPEYRGMDGAKLFMEVSRTLSKRGVKKAYLSCKLHQNHSRLFEGLGWKPTDLTFTKQL